jgi:hypothetical protein
MVTEEIIHLTTVYSTALLSAILPHISDFAEKFDLPIERPITVEQVQKFIPNPKGQMEGSLFLTNNAWFHFSKLGFVDSFSSPTNWFAIQELADIPFYYGKSTLSTNEIIEFALETVSKSGYPIATLNNPPKMEGPFDLENGEHVPYCSVEWYRGNEKGTWTEPEVSVTIDTQNKRLAGMGFNEYSDSALPKKPVKIDIKADTRAYFLQRTRGTTTNSPTRKTENYVKMTPAYSDALLSLILPRISTFARKLGVEWESPLKPDDVKSFWPCLAPGQNGGVLELKNGYRFTFDPAGYVSSFTAPEWFGNQWSGEEPLRYLGKPTMTTNEIYSLARETLLRLGFPPEITGSAEEPDLDWAYWGRGAIEYSDGEIPHCWLGWSGDSFDPSTWLGINAKDKKVEYLQITPAPEDGQKLGTPLKVDLPLESLYIPMTPDYSNALLSVILPRISEFADRLGLPFESPLSTNQIQQFLPSHVRGEVAGRLELTNHFWFEFDKAGYVSSFRSPNNYFFAEADHGLFPVWTPEKMRSQSGFFGKTLMSTNEIIALARETIRKLGRNAEKLQIDKTPELQGPYTLPGEVHLPYCRVECKLNSSKEPSEQDSFSHIEINTEKCEVVGFYLQLSGENVEKMANPLKIDLEPMEPMEPQIPQMGADF